MQLHTVRFRAMGSPCTIRLYAPSLSKATNLARPAIEEVERLEQAYSRYRSNSLLSRINAAAGQGPFKIPDDETAGILNYAYQAWEQSDGLFDITSGVLRTVWDFRSGKIPPQASIDDVLERIGMDKLEWTAPYLTLPKVGMELDFGGCVKEYAADAAATLCRAKGIESGIVELGGDVSVIGPMIDGSPWKVGIRNPRAQTQPTNTGLGQSESIGQNKASLFHIGLSAGAMASSGDYERCMQINGKRYSHILNPITGWPVPTPTHVSVVADSCLVAGTVSTVAMLKGESECLAWLDDIALPYYVVFQSGKIVNQL